MSASKRSVVLGAWACGALALAGCQKQTVTQAPAPVAAAPVAVQASAAQRLTGQVTAPEGLLDEPTAPRQAGLLDNWLNPRAAAFAATLSLGGVSVGVWNSDAFGMAIGSPIMVTRTDPRGYYVLPLPVTYVAGPALVLRVGSEGRYLRRVVTGVVHQDVSLATEMGLQVVLRQTLHYPVDIRIIPATQYVMVYQTIERDFRDYDLRPVLIKTKGPRKVVYEAACSHLVTQIQSRPSAITVVREAVREPYTIAQRQGRGVLLVKRDARGGPADESSRLKGRLAVGQVKTEVRAQTAHGASAGTTKATAVGGTAANAKSAGASSRPKAARPGHQGGEPGRPQGTFVSSKASAKAPNQRSDSGANGPRERSRGSAESRPGKHGGSVNKERGKPSGASAKKGQSKPAGGGAAARDNGGPGGHGGRGNRN